MMADLRVLHLADVHLGGRGFGLDEEIPGRDADLLDAFRRAVAHAVDPKQRIDLVVVAGDLFDAHRPAAPLKEEVAAAFRRLEERRIPAVLVPGCCDSLAYPDCVYRTERFPWVRLLPDAAGSAPGGPPAGCTITIRDVPVHLYGVAYRQSAAPASVPASTGKPGYHILLLHGTVARAPEQVHPRYVPVPVQALAESGMHYVALGHHHNFFEGERGGVRLVYPGTLEGKSFFEAGDRFLVTANLHGGKATVEKMPFQRRSYREFALDTAVVSLGSNADVERAVLRIAGPDDLIKVTVRGPAEFVLDTRALESRLRREMFHVAVVDETVVSASRMAATLAAENSARGVFVQRLRRRIPDADRDSAPVLEAALKAGLAPAEEKDADRPA